MVSAVQVRVPLLCSSVVQRWLPLVYRGKVRLRTMGQTDREGIAMSIFPTRILLATDGSEDAIYATEAAVELSKETSSELHVVYVGEDAYSATLVYPQATDAGGIQQEDPVFLEELERQFEQMARRVLDAEVEKVRAAGGTVGQAHLGIGEAATEIVDLAEKLSAGLIVVGSRGLSGIRRALIGSVSDSVIRHAHCPVLVVRK
jgi:nucleotide-binding universal stress UspA family protein